MLTSRYNHKDYEESIYKHSTIPLPHNGPKFCIMMPPPNVTGVLHLGHALTYTLQDILVRYKRLTGFDVLWQPGTDHAGIATQIIVESQLRAPKESLGKEKFLEKTWEWARYSQTKIVEQQEKLGILPNWDRSKFTLDPDLSKTVTKVFVKLYKDGLLYRDKRLVNFDYKLKTALSDLEVVNKEQQDKMYYIKYPVADASQSFIVVATTRPETIFADVALAVHPTLTQFHGKEVIIPLSGRKIPVIVDEYADPEKGSGVVKITPAHDFNDFEVGKRHNLESIDMLDEDGIINIGPFKDLKPLEARKEIEKVLSDLELIEKIDMITHTVPVSDRTGERIEPKLTTQWFCNMTPLAEKALEGAPRFIPEMWINTYNQWLTDIQPWCVSRQLWWGHEIPAYFGPDGTVFVEETKEAALTAAEKHYGIPTSLTQDSDVLDTWFSSALWPFSTLDWSGEWPYNQQSPYFPTSVLITGFDIIFFWVARMVMMSYYCTGQIPFNDVYIHALVRDAKGNKMSKSRGNVIDPLALIEQYGADALRLCLAALSVPGRDIQLSEKIVEGYSHFVTKLWNAGRFLEGRRISDATPQHPLNLWILHKLSLFIKEVESHLDQYRFDLAVKSFYEFFWNGFCDIYLESVKTLEDDEGIPLYVYLEMLKVMQPIIPLVTKHLFTELGGVAFETWPCIAQCSSVKDIDFLVRVLSKIRSVKGLLNLKSGLVYSIPSGVTVDEKILKHFLRASEVIKEHNKGIPVIVDGHVFYILVEDIDGAQQTLHRHLAKIIEDMKKTQALLNNPYFKNNKPQEWEEKQNFYHTLEHDHKMIQEMLD